MTWLQRYRLRHYVRNSIWIPPVVAMVAAMVLVRLLHGLEPQLGWATSFDPDSMRAVLGSLAGAMFTFIVFLGSSLLLVVQLASAQLTPRMIGVLFRDPVTKLTLSMFVFTFVFSISALLRIGPTVPPLMAETAAYCSAGCLALFLFLIDRVSKILRPSGALRAVAAQAHEVIDMVYPRRLSESPPEPASASGETVPTPAATVTSTKVGVVLAFDLEGLVGLAAKHRCVIELVPQVGSFVAPGDPLFHVHGASAFPCNLLPESIALGAERTMEQDPGFAFRVVVDIASKGLSPAINDPTTAVLAIDRLHHLLRHVGNRRLKGEHIQDAAGQVRLIYRTPNWEDFVKLAVTEIRQFGATSIQIYRRLRAMLDNLIQTLPAIRAPALREELGLLERFAERNFPEPEDRMLAAISDSQGVGGMQDRLPTSRPCKSP